MNMFKRASHLAKDTMDFVFGNMKVLKDNMIVIFPMFLVTMLINHFVILYKIEWAMIAVLLPMGYFVSCFFLSWHRVSLRGTGETPHNPLSFDSGSFRFHILFFAIFMTMGAINKGLKYLDANPGYIEANLALSMLFLLAAFAALYFLLRAMFFLPAQSVGVTLGFKDVMTASRGQVGVFVIATMFFGLALIVGVSIYTVVIGAINMFMIGEQEISKNSVVAFSFLFSVPIYFAMFIYAALEVTAISKLYQHGMQQNN